MPETPDANAPVGTPDLHAAIRDYYRERLEQGSCCDVPIDTGHLESDVAATLPMAPTTGAATGAAPGAATGAAEPAETVPSFGCGTPTEAAALRPGEVVVDLGSGAGLDCFRAAAAVGPEGRVIGVDMTPAMLARAREAATRLGFANVSFVEGFIEALPLEPESADVIISNCVVNLSPDKAGVFRESYRVLRPGGRVAISDMLLLGERREAATAEGWCACIDGAEDAAATRRYLEAAGFVDVAITAPPAGTEPGEVYSAMITARKPASDATEGIPTLF